MRNSELPPEEALAALAGHGVEVESGGLVATHATDPRGIPVELLRPDHRRRHRHGLHHYTRHRRETAHFRKMKVSKACVVRVWGSI